MPQPTFASPATVDLGQGRSLRLTALLGRGSCATVYRASWRGSLGLRRQVAVKIFDAVGSESHDPVVGGLAIASRRWACVHHPNVVRLEELGLLGPGRPFAVMELVEGRTLERLLGALALRRERMPLDLALFIGLELAEALAGARLACGVDGRRLRLVHGEVAACEVLLSWHGEVKLADFGLGAAARLGSSVCVPGAIVRRMRALAPEVANGRPTDARSDVFSLGVLLHELLVGPRFPALASERQTLEWVREGVVQQDMFQPRPPASVRAVLERALAVEPWRRYPHAGALAYELRGAALSLGVGDGRAFLRSTLGRVFGDQGSEDDAGSTAKRRAAPPIVFDRFARLRGSEPPPPAEPRESGTVLVGGAEDDDVAKEA